MTAGDLQFQAHLELLQFFLAHRDHIVDGIQDLLNAQRRPLHYQQDLPLLARDFEDCFFAHAGLSPGQSRLRGRLAETHWANGFRPKVLPGLHNGLVEPGEMMIRAFHLWRQTRWPGRNGRMRYANVLFNLYVIRELALLSMRTWDAGPDSAAGRLSRVQGVLDQLWVTSPDDQPVLVRDARWLIPLAQSPATDDLGAYFEVAEKVAASLSAEDRLGIHAASIRLAAGHLRSQIRYYSTKNGVPLDEQGLVVNTRSSNALDFALLIQDLVPVLEAYERAWQSGDGGARLDLADTICQGLSPDPALFLNRLELLGAYSMIEHLFVTTDPEGHADYTPAGRRHVELLQEYETRLGRVSARLTEDCLSFRPAAGSYSPYGVLYGFSSDLLEHMALKATQPDAVTRYGLEDVFSAGDAGSGKLAWVNGWRTLPHLSADVTRLFDYPQQFAEDIFDRLQQALRLRAADAEATAVPTGRLHVHRGDRPADTGTAIPDLPARYIQSSDTELVAAAKASPYDAAQLSTDRREGKYVLSYKAPGGWVAVKKAMLTEVLGSGHDAALTGLPAAAVDVLSLTCRRLVVSPNDEP